MAPCRAVLGCQPAHLLPKAQCRRDTRSICPRHAAPDLLAELANVTARGLQVFEEDGKVRCLLPNLGCRERTSEKKTDRGIIGEGNATQPSPQPCRASPGMSYLEEGSQPAHLHPHAVQGTLGELQSTNTGTVKLGAKADTRQESCSRANWGFGLGCFRTDSLYTALGFTRAGKQAEAFSQFLFYSVGHRTPVLPLEAQDSTILPLRHCVLHTLLAALLFLPRGLQGKWPHDFFPFPWPGSPHHLCATTGSGSWGKVTAMGRWGEAALQLTKLSQPGPERAKAENMQQGKSQVIFPHFTLMWSASCIVQSSAWSARWML